MSGGIGSGAEFLIKGKLGISLSLSPLLKKCVWDLRAGDIRLSLPIGQGRISSLMRKDPPPPPPSLEGGG